MSIGIRSTHQLAETLQFIYEKDGAGGRNRTGTPIQEQDFKSFATIIILLFLLYYFWLLSLMCE